MMKFNRRSIFILFLLSLVLSWEVLACGPDGPCEDPNCPQYSSSLEEEAHRVLLGSKRGRPELGGELAQPVQPSPFKKPHSELSAEAVSGAVDLNKVRSLLGRTVIEKMENFKRLGTVHRTDQEIDQGKASFFEFIFEGHPIVLRIFPDKNGQIQIDLPGEEHSVCLEMFLGFLEPKAEEETGHINSINGADRKCSLPRRGPNGYLLRLVDRISVLFSLSSVSAFINSVVSTSGEIEDEVSPGTLRDQKVFSQIFKKTWFQMHGYTPEGFSIKHYKNIVSTARMLDIGAILDQWTAKREQIVGIVNVLSMAEKNGNLLCYYLKLLSVLDDVEFQKTVKKAIKYYTPTREKLKKKKGLTFLDLCQWLKKHKKGDDLIRFSELLFPLDEEIFSSVMRQTLNLAFRTKLTDAHRVFREKMVKKIFIQDVPLKGKCR